MSQSPVCIAIVQYRVLHYRYTFIIIVCNTSCITQAPPGRAKCPADPHARRRPKREAKGREPAAAGHWDCGAIWAGAAVSPPGLQRIIHVAQMLGACGIQTDGSQHYMYLEVHVLQCWYRHGRTAVHTGLCHIVIYNFATWLHTLRNQIISTVQILFVFFFF